MSRSSKHPNIVRTRISKEMAFAVGYELLEEHFSTALYWSESKFYFPPHPTTFASEFARILQAREAYCILRLEHDTLTMTSAEQATHWIFTIYPVPRNLRSVVRASVVREAFPRLSEFLARCPTHRNYYNRCDVVFDPITSDCAVEQVHEI